MPVARPADPAVRAPARPVPAPTPAGPACLSWFDREEPLSPLATLAVLLSASMVLFACALTVWNELTGDDRGAVPVELTQFRAVTDVARPAAPVRVRIPAIGVDAALERLGKHRDGTVQVPRQPARAGCFTGGPRPGEPGSAPSVP